MLDTLDLELSLDKETYNGKIEGLMEQLRSLQQTCWEKKLPIIIVLEGWAVAGKGTLVKKMVGYMDPRGFTVHPTWPPTSTEREYPFLWRFWQKLPANGKISVFYHSWYTHVLEDRLYERTTEAEIPIAMSQINAFERQLVDDGVTIGKFWLHLSKKELKSRLEKAAENDLESWRIRPEDWQQAKRYDKYSKFTEEMLVHTSTGYAPWTLVEANCQRWARIKVLTEMTAMITQALDNLSSRVPPPVSLPQKKLEPTEPDLLKSVDLTLKLTDEDYKEQLREAQTELTKQQLGIYKNNIGVIVLFEGWDAAGKGGAIKRLTDTLDPRSYVVNAFAAPTQEEKDHHYLWRFWQKLPPMGKIGIFDRTWYGRVLVERIEGFANQPEWRRAYQEINEFEEQLTTAGYVIVKFWLHIDKDEQLARFQERQNNVFKEHKITDEDWRNRDKWDYYEVAVNQMLQRTSTPTAPWTIVAANDKYYARVKVLQSVTQAIKHKLKRL